MRVMMYALRAASSAQMTAAFAVRCSSSVGSVSAEAALSSFAAVAV
jgi:hypothetical protein